MRRLICERIEVGQAWSGYRGYLGRPMLALIAPDFLEREVFCCGPTPYMRAVRQLLEDAGFDMRHYHEESFGATPVEDIRHAEEHADEAEVLVGSNLNEEALEAGVSIPKACGMGICGACRVKVNSGQYDMEHSGGITEEEIEAGYVLSCCTRVAGAMEVEY